MGTGPDQWLEQVFFRQHVRCARAVMSVFGPNLRVCVEVFLGLVAVLATCVVVALHGAYVSQAQAPLAVELRKAVEALATAHDSFAVRLVVDAASPLACAAEPLAASACAAADAVYWFSRDKGVVALGERARLELDVPAATVRCGVGAFGGAPWLLRLAGTDCVVPRPRPAHTHHFTATTRVEEREHPYRSLRRDPAIPRSRTARSRPSAPRATSVASGPTSSTTSTARTASATRRPLRVDPPGRDDVRRRRGSRARRSARTWPSSSRPPSSGPKTQI